MNIFRFLSILLIFILSHSSLLAEEQKSGDDTGDGHKARLEELIQKRQRDDSTPESGNMPLVQPPVTLDHAKLSPANQALQDKAIGEYFVHVMESNEHQRNVFRWQLLSAKVIFVTVILLVVSGIYFAAVQFHHGLKTGKQGTENTDVEISLKAVKVSSPVLGVIILAISLAFFYLYLVHVYPVEFVR